MATNWSYVPIVGDYASDAFALNQGAGSTLAIPPAAQLNGPPRPGVLKWSFLLSSPDTLTNADDSRVLCVVKTPFPASAALGSFPYTNTNSLLPLLYAGVTDPSELAQQMVVGSNGIFTADLAVQNLPYLAGALDPNYLYAAVLVNLGAPAAANMLLQVTIDFSHSLIN